MPQRAVIMNVMINVIWSSALQEYLKPVLLAQIQTISQPPSTVPSSSLSVFLLLPLEHRASVKRFVSLQFLNLRQSAGLLGRVISPSQGLYLQTEKRAHTHTTTKHPCPEWDSNHDLGFRASEGSACLRPLDYRDRHFNIFLLLFYLIIIYIYVN
jgi:hypothetical protein